MTRAAERAAARFNLALGRPFPPGAATLWVGTATTRDGTEVVLKVARRHPESEHEADGLRLWDGHGAVRLLDAQRDRDTVALVLERLLPGTPLTEEPLDRQDEEVAAALRRLWVTPPGDHPFRPLAEMTLAWASEVEPELLRRHVDRSLVAAGLDLFRELPTTAAAQVLLATDLHAGNVLSARRAPWLAIDPKPYVGDPAYDLLQHLLAQPDRLAADPLGRTGRLAGLAGVPVDRLRAWLFARSVVEAARRPAPPLLAAARALAP